MSKRMLLAAAAVVLPLGTAMADCPTLPYTLTNGQTADATQVMSNLNSVRTCVNGVLTAPTMTGGATVNGATNLNGAVVITTTSASDQPLLINNTSSLGSTAGATNRSFIFQSKVGASTQYLQMFTFRNSAGSAWDTATVRLQMFTDSTGQGTVDFNPPGAAGQGGISLGANGSERLRIASNGYVGVGTTAPSYLLHVNGTAYATAGAGALSDVRHKADIEPLGAALDVVARLKPVSFNWKDPVDDGMRGRQMGFIAQDVEKVLPTAVLTQNDADHTLGLKYNEFIAVLTKAVQEQQDEVRALQAEVAALKTAK